MRKSIQAYAALRSGQDLARPTGNFGAFYNRLVRPVKQSKGMRLKRFAAFRHSQEQARPAGNYGAFYFKRLHGW